MVFSTKVVSECKIEDWRYYMQFDSFLTVAGTTTCASGIIRISWYAGEGENKKYLGLAEGLINGYTFAATAENVSQAEIRSIKYSIDDSF